LCLDHLRKKRPILCDRLLLQATGEPSLADQVEQHDREQLIQVALDSLPADYRMVVMLRYFEGLSSPEIAEAMDRSAKAVERLLARARDTLEPRLRPLL
jgi:RNA polymerase sigma-70 factor (ECF subfamily)